MKIKCFYKVYWDWELELNTDDIVSASWYDSWEAIPDEEKHKVVENYIIDNEDWNWGVDLEFDELDYYNEERSDSDNEDEMEDEELEDDEF